MKKITGVLTKAAAIVSAMGMTAAIGASSCFADTNISINDYMSNSVVGGDINMYTQTWAAGGNVTEQITTAMSGVVAGGNVNIADVSQLIGGNVIKTSTTAMDGVMIGGDVNILNIDDILGLNVGVGYTNYMNNAIVNGDINIANIANTIGIPANLTASVNNIMQNTVAAGSYGVLNSIN